MKVTKVSKAAKRRVQGRRDALVRYHRSTHILFELHRVCLVLKRVLQSYSRPQFNVDDLELIAYENLGLVRHNLESIVEWLRERDKRSEAEEVVR